MKTFTREDIKRIAEVENVRYLRLQFSDILGTVKNVEVPISQIDKALDGEMMFDGSSIEGFVRIEESDMYLVPDLSTWTIFPWTAGNGKVARLICDIYDIDGKPFDGEIGRASCRERVWMWEAGEGGGRRTVVVGQRETQGGL